MAAKLVKNKIARRVDTRGPNPVSLELAAALKRAGLTHNEAAKKLGVSRSQVSRLVSPRYYGHNLLTLLGLAEMLGCRLEVRLIKDEEQGD